MDTFPEIESAHVIFLSLNVPVTLEDFSVNHPIMTLLGYVVSLDHRLYRTWEIPSPLESDPGQACKG